MLPKRSPKVFISYRRADSADVAGRIFDRLASAFGKRNVFKDVDSIPPGSDFHEVIEETISRCDIAVVVIGQSWLKIQSEDGKVRLEDPADFVRLEIEAALNRDMVVIPTLLGASKMPNERQLPESIAKLTRRNAITVRADPDFHRDMDRLIESIRKQPRPRKWRSAPRPFRDSEISTIEHAYDSFDVDGHPSPLAASPGGKPKTVPGQSQFDEPLRPFVNKREISEASQQKSTRYHFEIIDSKESFLSKKFTVFLMRLFGSCLLTAILGAGFLRESSSVALLMIIEIFVFFTFWFLSAPTGSIEFILEEKNGEIQINGDIVEGEYLLGKHDIRIGYHEVKFTKGGFVARQKFLIKKNQNLVISLLAD